MPVPKLPTICFLYYLYNPIISEYLSGVSDVFLSNNIRAESEYIIALSLLTIM